MKATARAHPNIALVKYWGKRNEKLMLPQNSSISMTLNHFHTTTTVEFRRKLKKDSARINGNKITGGQLRGIQKPLNEIRRMAGIRLKARIESRNNFPTAAGLASSASGMAALALAASTATGLKLSRKELSIIARLGSGSASRSVYGGFSEWKKGKRKDGKDCYAIQIEDENYWKDFRMITTIVSDKEKKIKSRAGMAQTVKTSPYYEGWMETVEKDLQKVRRGIKRKNFKLVGETAERSSLKMHATMITTKPSIVYWQPLTLKIIHLVESMREKGVPCYHTMDAGPNVKIMVLRKNENKVMNAVKKIKGVTAVSCKPGSAAHLIKRHLF